MPIDATRPYDDSNIFARILRGELTSKTVYEDEYALAFHDINPQATLHILVIPKGARSEEHTSELQSLMRKSYAVFCLKKNTTYKKVSITSITDKKNTKLQ